MLKGRFCHAGFDFHDLFVGDCASFFTRDLDLVVLWMSRASPTVSGVSRCCLNAPPWLVLL